MTTKMVDGSIDIVRCNFGRCGDMLPFNNDKSCKIAFLINSLYRQNHS